VGTYLCELREPGALSERTRAIADRGIVDLISGRVPGVNYEYTTEEVINYLQLNDEHMALWDTMLESALVLLEVYPPFARQLWQADGLQHVIEKATGPDEVEATGAVANVNLRLLVSTCAAVLEY
jgi:hypothetical protein